MGAPFAPPRARPRARARPAPAFAPAPASFGKRREPPRRRRAPSRRPPSRPRAARSPRASPRGGTRHGRAHSFLGASFRPSWGPGGRLAHVARRTAAEAATKGGFAAAAAEGGVATTASRARRRRRRRTLRAHPGGRSAVAKRLALEVASARCERATEFPSTPGRDSDSETRCPRLAFRCSRLELPDLCRAHLGASARGGVVVRAPPRETRRGSRGVGYPLGALRRRTGRGAARIRLGQAPSTRKDARVVTRPGGSRRRPGGGGGRSRGDDVRRRGIRGEGDARRRRRGRDPRLATLTAQIGVGGAGAALAAAQLDLWRGSPAEKYVPEETLALYGSLAAGEVAPPQEPLVPRRGLATVRGGWRGVAHPPTASAARVVEGYLDAVEKGAAALPVPPVARRSTRTSARLKDLCFNLLVLASSGGAPEGVSTASAFHAHVLRVGPRERRADVARAHAARAPSGRSRRRRKRRSSPTRSTWRSRNSSCARGGGRGVGGGEGRGRAHGGVGGVCGDARGGRRRETRRRARDSAQAVRGLVRRRGEDCVSSTAIGRAGRVVARWRPTLVRVQPVGRRVRERDGSARGDVETIPRSSRVFTDRELRRLRESRRRDSIRLSSLRRPRLFRATLTPRTLPPRRSTRSELEVEHGHGVVAVARRQLVSVLVPAHLEDASVALERLHQLPILGVPGVQALVEDPDARYFPSGENATERAGSVVRDRLCGRTAPPPRPKV